MSDIDRLKAGRFRPACAVCGRDDGWRLFGKEIDGNPTRLVLGASWPDGTPVEDYGLPVLAFACWHCGNVRLMAADWPEIGDEPEPEPEPHD